MQSYAFLVGVSRRKRGRKNVIRFENVRTFFVRILSSISRFCITLFRCTGSHRLQKKMGSFGLAGQGRWCSPRNGSGALRRGCRAKERQKDRCGDRGQGGTETAQNPGNHFIAKAVKEDILTEKKAEIGSNLGWTVRGRGTSWREAGGCGGELPRTLPDPADIGAWGGERP